MRKCTKRWLLPVCAAAMTLAAGFSSLAAETVKVTVPNVKGGYLEVGYFDEETGNEVCLPIGEVSEVPKGVELDITANQIAYQTSQTEEIRTFVQSASVNGSPMEIDDPYYQQWSIMADSDLKLDAVFKGLRAELYESAFSRKRLAFKESCTGVTGMYNAGAFPNKQLTIYEMENRKDHGYSGVQGLTIDEVRFNNEEVDKALFSIDGNGVFRATKPLETGIYRIYVSYAFNNQRYEDVYLSVYVGPRITASVPLAVYREPMDRDYMETILSERDIEAQAKPDDTFKAVFDGMEQTGNMLRLQGYTATGIGFYTNGAYKSLMDRKVRDIAEERDPRVYLEMMYKGYKPAEIQLLGEEDIVPEEVEPGWHQQNGKWYFYETEDPASLVKNQWITCPEGNGCTEQVWVGADGAMAVNGVVNAQGKSYLVAENGHKVKGKTVTLNGVTYTTDGDGEITEAKVILATPSNAAEALAQADKVIANADIMSQDEKEQAADMQTEALKTKIDITKLTADQVAKYEAPYLAVYGADNIETEPSDAVGGIAAAGLTSEDFAEGGGKVTIEYATEWPATSSNARVRGSVKLLVNGKERKTLTAPVTMTVEIPDYFIASYSNASYNYEVEGVDKADVDGEKGTVKITITKLGAFDVKAVKKPSRPSGGGSNSGNSHSSGRARVKADFYKSGKWVMNEKGWWYSYDDGTWPSNSWVYLPWKDTYQWYYFNGEGYMVTGWHHWQNNWYYLYPQADGNRGYMFTGWHEIGGKWYYFSKVNDSSLGAMAYDTTTPDGYKVDKDGAWIQ